MPALSDPFMVPDSRCAFHREAANETNDLRPGYGANHPRRASETRETPHVGDGHDRDVGIANAACATGWSARTRFESQALHHEHRLQGTCLETHPPCESQINRGPVVSVARDLRATTDGTSSEDTAPLKAHLESVIQEDLMPALSAGNLAPDITLQDTKGGHFSLKEALKNGPVLLTLSSRFSCPTCQVHPALSGTSL